MYAAAIPVALANPDLPEQPPLLRDVAVDPAEQHALGQVALEEGSWLQVIEDPMQCRTLQQLAARVHREQLPRPRLRRRARRWTRTRTRTSPDRRDRVPASASGPLPAPQAQLTLRDDAASSGAARVPGKNFEHEPMIAV